MGIDRKYRLARIWSNNELRKFAHLFSGAVVNVSGWLDSDKQGGCYQDYFSGKDSYSITNYSGERGFQNSDGEINLDLTEDLPAELAGKFDVVFNHTTLEHIYNFQKAFSAMCTMTRDVVVMVVPFSQEEHGVGSWGDYWRFAPMGVRKMFEENGLTVLYESANDDRNAAVYLFYIASRNADKWDGIIEKGRIAGPAGAVIGRRGIRAPIKSLIARIGGGSLISVLGKVKRLLFS